MNAYQKEYINRINRVSDYIDAHITEPLDVQTLASVAGFSPFHFHRIFSAFTGETLIAFVKRLRTEKAASMLLNYPGMPVSNIAWECGFSSPAVFCRSFRDHFGISAVDFRKTRLSDQSKDCKTDGKNCKAKGKNRQLTDIRPDYLRRVEQKTQIAMKKTNVEIREMPELSLVYCRHTGAFNQIGKAYEKLFRWAGPRGLLRFPETKGVTVFHDDPNVTEMQKLRQSACITVQGPVKTEGEFGTMTVPAGRYAVGRFEITETGFQDAWDSMCLWVSESGYQPADGFPYELYHNNHEEHPEKKHILDICIPVKPL